MTTREWYRSTMTGDRGYRETRDGIDYVILDRPGVEIIKRYKEKEWTKDVEVRPLSRIAIAQVAHAADHNLCRVLGHLHSSKEWIDLTGNQRVRWMNTGPQKSSIRRRLFNYVKVAIEWLSNNTEPPPDAEDMTEALRCLREARDSINSEEKHDLTVEKLIEILWSKNAEESD